LVIEKENTKNGKIAKQQFLVYFVYFMSEVLTRSKKFYSEMEKNCYAVIISVRKLRHYFKAHTIKVLTNCNRDNFRRTNKWAMELSKYIISFEK
jgi:hypothetical protein